MGKAITGHVDLVYPSKYIKAADLRGRDVTVTIAAVEWETLVMQGGKKDTKVAITMARADGKPIEKKWIAPKTVLKMIAAATGEKDVSQWKGRKVTIYPTTCRGQKGEEVECIRVRVRTSQTQDEPPAEMTAPVDVAPVFDDEPASDTTGAVT